jgi:hypothetical protein
MLATSTGSRAIFLVLAICLVGGRSTYAQSASSLNPSKSIGNRMSSGAWLAKCAAFSMPTLAGIPTGEADEWPPIPSGTTADAAAVRYPNPLCVEPALSATSRGPALASADNPCGADAVGGSDIPRSFPCNASADAVPAELSALGKAGAKIARARKEVLNILLAENACTEWFETKESAPAATFQSLSFELDEHGPQDVLETQRVDASVLWHQPYVASATQDGGAHSAITINANGAFYRALGQVLKVGQEAGPEHSDGTELLTVGKYAGGTLPAQMITLLHEFGHIVDLLPEDADNLDGKSVRNTDEVLRHCRGEVEARAQQAKQSAKR